VHQGIPPKRGGNAIVDPLNLRRVDLKQLITMLEGQFEVIRDELRVYL
jgi:hypothetical protein